MNPVSQFLRRFVRSRRYGVAFRGVARTSLPDRIRFSGKYRHVRIPQDPLHIADFINVILDDDYGVRSTTGDVKTIVDIGANVGLFTSLAREQFPDAVIHSYEPSPFTAAYARDNTRHPLTTLYEEGVAAKDSRANMVELGVSTLAQTIAADEGSITLTSFAKVLERAGGRIDLLKVDCEGAEWDFMTGADQFRQVGQIRMEYHLVGNRTLNDLHAMAKGIGFEVCKLQPNDGFGIAWLKPVS
jgi:FkbM family methyltransferase